MTRRRGKLRPCVWCGQVVGQDERRPCLTYDYDNGRYHVRCLVLKLYAKGSASAPERRP